ncbi:MAG: CDC48 family AAA ATPase, partial [Nanoarchaeota archaeon]|nr:CDC48 family AAA ATPase [Nanoarchaeota archaeon]
MAKIGKDNKNQVTLKVVEALQDDAYKGIARLDLDLMRNLGVRRGDAILIGKNKLTVAIADRAYPADVGEGIIRIDGILRKNAGVSIGDEVIVKKAEIKEAKKIVVAPAQKGIMVQGDPEGLRRGLLGRTVVKGDLVVLGGVQRRRDLMNEDMGDLNDIFGNLGDILGGMGFGNLGGGVAQIKFLVVSTNPNSPVIVTENTEVVLNPKAVEVTEDRIPNINYEDIGGLTGEIKKIREMVEIPMKHPEIFQKLGVTPPKGVLLHGPPGTGKTLLAKAVATETDAHFILLNGPEIMSKFYGESEKKIRTIFEEAEKNAPSIIFIDEIDAIAPKREDVQGEVERRVVSQLLTMMDGLNARGKVIVIGATNRVNSLDPALRRPGRFDREIEIGVPDKAGRLSVLKIHSRGMPFDKSVNLDKIASLTHGFVGADLESLTKEAAINVLRKHINKIKLDEEVIPQEVLDKLIIKQEDFMDALKVVRPSAMREVLVETPNVDWNSVGGLDKVKKDLIEAVEWPMKYPDSFKRMGIRPSRGILLYGPPGTGKTLLAKAVAKESEANFIHVKGPSLLSMWVGKSEEGMRKVFERARQVAPCIIFFDELDSLAGKRGTDSNKVTERVLNQMLAEMDGLEDIKEVLVLAATNRPDMLDTALLRPGRFDKILLVNAPTEKGREMILKIHTKDMPLSKDVNISELAKETDGYTGADLEAF